MDLHQGQRVQVTGGRRFGHVGTVLGTEWFDHCLDIRVQLDGVADSELFHANQLTREPRWPNQRQPIVPADECIGLDVGLVLVCAAVAMLIVGFLQHRPDRQWPRGRPDPMRVDVEDTSDGVPNAPTETEF